ncbi:MAG TPA: hypothetical protein VLX91_16195 [Candidatus Acidoferrales bacterium]|nr:hypothetical protein [Candidatus Acidoferrales bacterium]
MKRKSILLLFQRSIIRAALLVLLFCTSNVCAQDGTPLAAKGIGAFTSFGSSWSAGMGNSGIALTGNGFLSCYNPATWSGLQNVQFTVSYDFSGLTSRDDSTSLSSYYANGNFGGGIFALPIDANLGMTVAAGFTPLTSYNFSINSSFDSNYVPTVPSYAYKSSGSGGLGEGFVGMSFSPFHDVNLGGMFQYAFGRIENTTTVDFNNSSYTNTYSDYSSYMQGSSGTIGIVLDSLDKLVQTDFLKGVSLGGFYKFAYNLRGTSVLENLYEDTLYSPFSQGARGYIPPEFGIGISKSFSNRVRAMLDIRTQSFSKYYDTYTPAGSLKDALFIGGGVEILQGREFSSLFDKRILRAGLYYQKTQFVVRTKSGQDKQMDEFFLTAGVEVPLSFSSTASISAQYGLRGLSSDFLLREQIFRLYFSITMGEGWFARPEGD